VERPQPEARTNDVDAGDERRRIDQEPWCTISLLGAGDTAVTITSDQRVVGQAGIGCRASLRAAGAHGALRPQPDRLNHEVDRATEVGVMPNCELVPWLCPISLMPPRRG
jgi:hypothetical protein